MNLQTSKGEKRGESGNSTNQLANKSIDYVNGGVSAAKALLVRDSALKSNHVFISSARCEVALPELESEAVDEAPCQHARPFWQQREPQPQL